MNQIAFWSTWAFAMGIVLPLGFRLGHRMGRAGVPVARMHMLAVCWSVFFCLIVVGVATVAGWWFA